jgi:hypothetical protein
VCKRAAFKPALVALKDVAIFDNCKFFHILMLVYINETCSIKTFVTYLFKNVRCIFWRYYWSSTGTRFTIVFYGRW